MSIERYGGSMGTRDQGGLESALARPYSAFAGEELYASPIAKAAAVGESIIMNHPFVDGNRRTGVLAMHTVLREEGLMICADEESLYAFVVAIAAGKMNSEEIVEWLKANTQPR